MGKHLTKLMDDAILTAHVAANTYDRIVNHNDKLKEIKKRSGYPQQPEIEKALQNALG